MINKMTIAVAAGICLGAVSVMNNKKKEVKSIEVKPEKQSAFAKWFADCMCDGIKDTVHEAKEDIKKNGWK